ncbi:hypothetical protein RZN22_18745, partial [Bacillaceae bacterium S4-13-58]
SYRYTYSYRQISGCHCDLKLLQVRGGTYEMIQMNRLVFSQLIQEKESEIVDQMQGMFIMKMMGHLANLLYENFPDKEDQLLTDEEQ